MKCPKCGYNSFEIHDACKKCAHDLTSYKDIHGLKPIVLSQEVRTVMADKLMAEMDHGESVAADVPTDMFSFDIPEDSAAAGQAAAKNDPFNFDDDPISPASGGDDFSFSAEQKTAQAKAEEDAFADLLETTPQVKEAGTGAGQGASELDNFSWDDTPDEAPGAAAKPADDFNSLFGETDETAKK